ncbi:YihY/virulence factor BrkB family protein [Corynebacterium halotolerans]|uniref:YihY/virulence factor BrkB family protein n=1 Tax=Corynebacterium halotolerans YIM 70093 = DSM 44683 TaxID=1121362 RepID=M1P3I3_9CORY|nr:YihY/virulence factor BrkB family protein [Corynebacterium halotolerans]AGF71251.1 hypothetical protein A605_01185 [Corynebacterium halotolerans YIM 70093 = DSM 44683]
MPHQEYIDATLAVVGAPGPEHEDKPRNLPRLSWTSWRYALRRTVREFFAEGIIDLAAMLTFFTVLSLGPAVLVIYSIITLVLSNNAAEVARRVENFVRDRIPAEYQNLALDLIDAVTGSPTGGAVALAVGITVALWTSSAYVRAFSRGSNSLYGRTEGRGFLRKAGAMLLTNLGLLVGIVTILVSLVLNETLVDGVLGPVAEPLGLSGVLDFLLQTFLPVWAWLKWPVILALLIGFVAVLYYFTPNVRQPKFRWLTPGSAVAVLGIVAAGAALYIYFSVFAGYSSYGAVGTVMALLFTLWVFNIVLLLGVKLDAEVERARQLQAGIPAEENIQLPPRDIIRVEKMRKTQEQLTSDGRELRRTHNASDGAGEDARDSGGAAPTGRPGSTAYQAPAGGGG